MTPLKHRPITDVTELKNRYCKCFDIIGNFDREYSFVTDANMPPVQHSQCKIPIKLQEKIEVKLDDILGQGIIIPVMELAEWVKSMTDPINAMVTFICVQIQRI